MNILLVLALSLFVGLMLSRVAKKLGLPAVTAYLVTGVLIGPFCLGAFGIPGLGFISEDEIGNFAIISEVALGFIAFSIGNEFRLAQLKQIGKSATVIGIFQAVFTTLVVDAALISLSFALPAGVLPLPVAVVLGAVASATAPAATLMVVRQYKAKGRVTDTLLPVVAIDDAVGLVLFAVSFGIAKAMMNGTIDPISIIVEPLVEVVVSLLLGFVVGLVFTYSERFFHSRSKRLSMSVAFVLLTVAVSMIDDLYVFGVHVAFSPLLACMMLGTTFCNICDFSEELMDRLDRWTAPLFILFFVISGAELNLLVFTEGAVVLIGVAYILFRSLGKYYGARLSADMVKADKSVRKYLGITLLPQAGVALGMAFEAEKALGAVGALVANITLFSVLIYELFGPYLTKLALQAAGEIDPEGKTSARGVFHLPHLHMPHLHVPHFLHHEQGDKTDKTDKKD